MKYAEIKGVTVTAGQTSRPEKANILIKVSNVANAMFIDLHMLLIVALVQDNHNRVQAISLLYLLVYIHTETTSNKTNFPVA